MHIIDISQSLSPYTPVYPDNPTFSIEKVKKVPEDSATVSRICFGSHFGTHVDAPCHILEHGQDVASLNLKHFIGECSVLDLSLLQDQVLPKDLEGCDLSKPIILLKTRNSIQGFAAFHEDFVYLTEEAADFLLQKELLLIGIDAPSIKQFHVQNAVHEKFLKAGIPIVEGLDLSKVDEGIYNFIGLPLKIDGADGSPIRAALYR